MAVGKFSVLWATKPLRHTDPAVENLTAPPARPLRRIELHMAVGKLQLWTMKPLLNFGLRRAEENFYAKAMPLRRIELQMAVGKLHVLWGTVPPFEPQSLRRGGLPNGASALGLNSCYIHPDVYLVHPVAVPRKLDKKLC